MKSFSRLSGNIWQYNIFLFICIQSNKYAWHIMDFIHSGITLYKVNVRSVYLGRHCICCVSSPLVCVTFDGAILKWLLMISHIVKIYHMQTIGRWRMWWKTGPFELGSDEFHFVLVPLERKI